MRAGNLVPDLQTWSYATVSARLQGTLQGGQKVRVILKD